MALTLKWNDNDLIYTAVNAQQFTVELRCKTGLVMPVALAYNQQVQTAVPFQFNAVTAEKTLAVVYEATPESARVELWEVDASGSEQLLTYRFHNPGKSYMAIQIN